jgi:molybdate transport repressor ModE-like protein
MKRMEIRPAWVFSNDAGEEVDHRLFDLLHAVHESGKLTVAAQRVAMSYRHAWNIIARWSAFFGADLVVLEQGRGARLSPLGEKLIWAEARARARLLPQLENIASELNLEISRALAEHSPMLRIHASYGYAVAQLPELLRRHTQIGLDLQYLSAADALASLARGACDIAGFHVPEGQRGARAVAEYRSWLSPATQTLIYLVHRQQGIFVKPGNPKRIESIAALTRADVRFINRQRGSGTRLLLETLLEEQALDPRAINGWPNEEYTHAAVAAYVASGMADAGFGVQAAARDFHLDFVPVASERYFLLTRRETLAYPSVQELLRLLRGPEFDELTRSLPGYRADRAGEIMELSQALPGLSERLGVRASDPPAPTRRPRRGRKAEAADPD